MKKVLLSMIICIIFLFSLTSFAFAGTTGSTYAAVKITEVPDVKIVMDGKVTSYHDVLISINERTLLPFRELLVSLGVPDDDSHIIWNPEERSVTVYKDTTKLYLKVGSKTVYVDDQPVVLDVAPAEYDRNQQVYIPIRFVCEALDNKVIWDGPANTILIRDISEYEQIREILDKSDTAMQSVKKCKMALDMDVSVGQEYMNMKMNFSVSTQIDREKKLMYATSLANVLGMELKTDTYYYDNIMYEKGSFGSGWEKQTYTADDFAKLFENESDVSILKAYEPLCAGLVLTQSEKPDEILLKGDIFPGELLNKAMRESDGLENSADISNVDQFNVEISIDKNTYLVNKIVMTFKATEETDGNTSQMDMIINAAYSDYNGDFEIVVPAEAIDNAVETKDLSTSPIDEIL